MCTFILCLLYAFIDRTGLVDFILSSSLLYLNIFGCEMKHLWILLDKLSCLTFLFPPCFIWLNFSRVFTLAFPYWKWRVAQLLNLNAPWDEGHYRQDTWTQAWLMIGEVAFKIGCRKCETKATVVIICQNVTARISGNYRMSSGFTLPSWTQMYKHTHTGDKEGANLPPHDHLSPHVFVKTHLDPDWQAFADNCIIVLIHVFECHGILFAKCSNLLNYSNTYESITLWPKDDFHRSHLKSIARTSENSWIGWLK